MEFKRESPTGRLVAIEPNVGRPTGRSTLAEASQVELHAALCRDVLVLSMARLPEQSDGVKWIHLLGDFQSTFHHLRRGELDLRDWLESVRGRKVHAVFRLGIPYLSSIPWVLASGSPSGKGLGGFRSSSRRGGLDGSLPDSDRFRSGSLSDEIGRRRVPMANLSTVSSDGFVRDTVDMCDPLLEIAGEPHCLTVIEHASQAHGAR